MDFSVIIAQRSVAVTLMHVIKLQENVLDAASISGLIYLPPDVKKTYSLYITGIIYDTGNKTNPGTQWSVTCWVEELQQNSSKYTVFLSQSIGLSSTSFPVTSNLTKDSSRSGLIQRGSTFTTTDAQAGETYYCVIQHSTGFAWVNTTLSHYELPIISETPEIVNMSQTSITIEWRAWDEQTDVGDPPVVGYIVYYRKDAFDGWSTDTIIEASQLLQYTHTNLEEDTKYIFSVSAVREGDMGEGPMGPPLTVKTLCEDVKNNFAVQFVIPTVFAIALVIILMTCMLIYRKRSTKAAPTPSDLTSFTNNIAIDKENQESYFCVPYAGAYPGFSNPGGANYYLSGAPPSVGAQRTRKFLVLKPPDHRKRHFSGLK
ncbi:hypothetical protein BSL78_13700 [Apostichopus japonicus]|uniref:Fibronectin type-III domain-containing protein n=1 Tax=Stichopus japonicus TaxID=307972 RepID=A0A2G8KN86_STIJA|nr:hypothetical protein BSL78_13700 [Apostichopus japonicus]